MVPNTSRNVGPLELPLRAPAPARPVLELRIGVPGTGVFSTIAAVNAVAALNPDCDDTGAPGGGLSRGSANVILIGERAAGKTGGALGSAPGTGVRVAASMTRSASSRWRRADHSVNAFTSC